MLSWTIKERVWKLLAVIYSAEKRNAEKRFLGPADVTMAAQQTRVFFNNLPAATHLIGRPLSPWWHCRRIIFLTCAETIAAGLVSITALESVRLTRSQSCVWMCVVSSRDDTFAVQILLRWPTKKFHFLKFLRSHKTPKHDSSVLEKC